MALLYTILIIIFLAFAPRRFYRILDKHNDDPFEEWILGWGLIVVLFIIAVMTYFLYREIQSVT